MKTLNYQTTIKASPERVHDVMLGLSNKKTYEQWTAAFNPTSTWEGNWDKGSKMLFVGTSETGEKGGMVSRIVENTPGKLVSIQHYGILENGEEITSGPKVEGWGNAMEVYRIEKSNDGTLLKIELDATEEFASYFDDTWPKALEILKSLCE